MDLPSSLSVPRPAQPCAPTAGLEKEGTLKRRDPLAPEGLVLFFSFRLQIHPREGLREGSLKLGKALNNEVN